MIYLGNLNINFVIILNLLSYYDIIVIDITVTDIKVENILSR